MWKKLVSFLLVWALLLPGFSGVKGANKTPTAWGIDVSYYQGDIDWDTVAKYIDFAIIRCGVGQDRTSQDDKQWLNNVRACTRLKIPFGVYLYSYATTDAAARSEARHVIRLLKEYDPSLPVFLDLEDKSIANACTPEEILRHATIFCDMIREAGYTPGIYSNLFWWNHYLTSPEYDKWEHWVAQYNSYLEYEGPMIMWQYSNQGTVKGIQGHVDLNYWYKEKPTVDCAHSYTCEILREPTCTEPELRVYTCSLCGHSYEEPGEALGHSYEETVIPPACQTEGKRVKTCTLCGYVCEEILEPLGHSYAETELPPNCEEGGTQVYTCTLCGDSYQEDRAPGTHSYEGNVTPPGCESPGHGIFTCTRCGYTYEGSTEPLGHSYEETVIPPTCEDGGRILYTCTRCGHTYEEATDLDGHSYEEVVIPPTCEDGGRILYTCTLCGYSYEEPADLDGHSYEEVVIPPTCEEEGRVVYTCTLCGYSYEELTDLEGHSYEEVVTPPTCEEEGCVIYTCTLCGYSYEEATEPTGHSYRESVIPPTCEDFGYRVYTCACGDSYRGEELSPTYHMPYKETVTLQPTEEEEGEKVISCRTCGKIISIHRMPSAREHREDCVSGTFTDVPAYWHWAHEGIDYVLEWGLFRGVGNQRFDPEGSMTRAMLVTVLWRLEGCPQPEQASDFVDVDPGAWYADAVAWAQERGIVKGVGRKQFDPMGKITREQFATILYRLREPNFSEYVPEDVLDGFSDQGEVSDYAREALSWAVYKGYITGTKGNGRLLLAPQGKCTRAQAATILYRLPK